MKTSLLLTVAAAAFSAVLATGNVFAQDETLPKRQQQQQREAPTGQQEPANQTGAPIRGSDQSQPGLSTEQPRKKSTDNPAGNADQATPAQRKPIDKAKCSTGQEANCSPSQTPRTGEEQPQNGLKPKNGVKPNSAPAEAQPAEQPVQHKKHPAGENAPQPAEQAQPEKKQPTDDRAQPMTPGMKPKQQTGETQPSNSDVDVVGNLDVPKEKVGRVRDRLLRSSERSNVDVDVNIDVGQALPARVRPRPLPPDIVEIAPEYRSYDYVVVRDEIVIVEPRSRKVIQVIRKGGGVAHARAANKIRLTAAQRRMILDYAKERGTARAERSFDAEAGMSVPSDVELVPMPDRIITEVPAVRSYDFFVDSNNDVVLVEPDSRAVIEVIQ